MILLVLVIILKMCIYKVKVRYLRLSQIKQKNNKINGALGNILNWFTFNYILLNAKKTFF